MAVYPCTYRELWFSFSSNVERFGISLYLQGTLAANPTHANTLRYIPVPTGNSSISNLVNCAFSVYPCTYRELNVVLVKAIN